MAVLVGLGADVLALDNVGRSPLKIASLQRHNHIVRYLSTCVAGVSSRSTLDTNDDLLTQGASREIENQSADTNTRVIPRMCAVCSAAHASHVGSRVAKVCRLQGCEALQYNFRKGIGAHDTRGRATGGWRD